MSASVEVKGSSKLSVVAYATAVDGREVKLKFPISAVAYATAVDGKEVKLKFPKITVIVEVK